MRDAYHEKKFKSNDFLFIHKNGKHFKCDHLNNWLQNAMAIVARKIKIKLNHFNYLAHSLRQGGCTDMVKHNVPSCRIEMTRRWSSKM